MPQANAWAEQAEKSLTKAVKEFAVLDQIQRDVYAAEFLAVQDKSQAEKDKAYKSAVSRARALVKKTIAAGGKPEAPPDPQTDLKGVLAGLERLAASSALPAAKKLLEARAKRVRADLAKGLTVESTR